jgi:hypothetical protein
MVMSSNGAIPAVCDVASTMLEAGDDCAFDMRVVITAAVHVGCPAAMFAADHVEAHAGLRGRA